MVLPLVVIRDVAKYSTIDGIFILWKQTNDKELFKLFLDRIHTASDEDFIELSKFDDIRVETHITNTTHITTWYSHW